MGAKAATVGWDKKASAAPNHCQLQLPAGPAKLYEPETEPPPMGRGLGPPVPPAPQVPDRPSGEVHIPAQPRQSKVAPPTSPTPLLKAWVKNPPPMPPALAAWPESAGSPTRRAVDPDPELSEEVIVPEPA